VFAIVPPLIAKDTPGVPGSTLPRAGRYDRSVVAFYDTAPHYHPNVVATNTLLRRSRNSML
jgi:hypothetical protein